MALFAAMFTASAQSWVQTAAPNTNWACIACSADGINLVAGNPSLYQNSVSIVYVSHDSGATWTPTDVPDGLWRSVASSAEGVTLLAADASSELIYSSSDSGLTWHSNGVPKGIWPSLACSADGTKLFAAGMGIYVSTNSGLNWASSSAPEIAWNCVACSASGTTALAVTGLDGVENGSVWVSTNSGGTWGQVFTNPSIAFACACSADGRTMVAGGGGTVFTSTNYGAAWSTNNLPPFWNWERVACSAQGTRIAAEAVLGGSVGSYPAGYAYVFAGEGTHWTQFPGLDPNNPTMNLTGLAMSADGGKLFGSVTEFTSGIVNPPEPGGIFVLQFELTPLLALSTTATNLILSWGIPSATLVLQTSPDLASTNWSPVIPSPGLNYSTLRYEVSVELPKGNVFYRLASP